MAKLEERLRYIIEAIWKGDGATAAASRGIEGVGESAKKTDSALKQLGKGWAAMATPLNQTLEIVGKVSQAFKDAWAFLGEGAELSRTAEIFDNLSASIGTTADALLTNMGEASAGMMSNANMMASASDIIRLGLADTEDGVVRLANLVARSGWDMQQVIMTFANDSKMRLDALGLSVTDVEARIKKYTDAGMDASEAFDLAVIEAGEAKLLLLGDAAESTAGKMKILEASVDDFKDAFQQTFSELATEDIFDVLEFVGYENAEGREAGEQVARDVYDGLLAGLAGLALPGLGILALIPGIGTGSGLIGRATTKIGKELAKLFGADNPELQAEANRLRGLVADNLDAIATEAEQADSVMLQLTGGVRAVADEYDNLFRLTKSGAISMPLVELQAGMQWRADQGIEEAAQAAAEAYASTFQQSLQTEGGIDFGALWLNMGVEAGLGMEQLVQLGLAAGLTGEKLKQAAIDAALFPEAIRLFGQVQDGTRSVESMQWALEKLRGELENWKLEVPAREVSTAGEDIKRATLGMEGISTTGWTNKIVGPMNETNTAAGTLATTLGTLETAMLEVDGLTAETIIKDNAEDATENADKFRRYWDENMAGGFETTATVHWVTDGMPPPGAPPVDGNRAWGGPVSRGSAYVVGEKGPEVFVPSSSGWIVPNAGNGTPAMWSGAGAGQPVTVNNNFNGLGVAASVAVARRVMANYTRGTR